MGSGPVQIGYRRIRATQTFQRTRPLQEGGPRPEVNLPFPSLFFVVFGLVCVLGPRDKKTFLGPMLRSRAHLRGKISARNQSERTLPILGPVRTQPDPEPIRMGWAQNSARLYREPIKMGPGPSNRKVTDLLVMILFCSFRLRMILFC